MVGSLRMRLALFQPDIPQNLGAAIRLCACLGIGLDVIEPCAFPIDDRTLRRAALDYQPLASINRHDGWGAFESHEARQEGRLVLFTTKGALPYADFRFQPGDTLIFGRESAGVTQAVVDRAEARLLIPMVAGARSINVVTAAAMALGEALRQTNGFSESV